MAQALVEHQQRAFPPGVAGDPIHVVDTDQVAGLEAVDYARHERIRRGEWQVGRARAGDPGVVDAGLQQVAAPGTTRAPDPDASGGGRARRVAQRMDARLVRSGQERVEQCVVGEPNFQGQLLHGGAGRVDQARCAATALALQRST